MEAERENGQEHPPEPRPWSAALVEWALAVLPPRLAGAQREELEATRLRWEEARLEALGRSRPECRVQALVELARSEWHPRLARRVTGLIEGIIEELTLPELQELARLALESGLLKLAEQEDLEPADRRLALLAERAQLLRVRQALCAAFQDCAKPDKTESRQLALRLARLARRLHNRADEALSLERLERIFGHGPWQAFSRLTFLLLLVLLILITWELVGSPPAAWRTPLVWIDTGICLVFLLEFGLQLACVPRRLSWFSRHFLTDFLPAIPFALIAHVGEGLELMIRSVRFLRAFRFARYLRALKPVVGLARLLVFWIRGMDRIVESMAPLLNRRILFFDHPREVAARTPAPPEEDREGKIMAAFARLDPEMQERAAPGLLHRLAREIGRQAERGIPPPAGEQWEGSVSRQESRREIRAEQAILTLRELTAEAVEARLAPATTRGLARLLALLDLPLVRRLPLIRGLVYRGEKVQPAERVALAGRALGRASRRLLGLVTTWADLSGVITPSQILDRVSTALIKSTQRPAVRLLLFGGLFLVLRMMVELFTTIPWDSSLVGGFLNKFVATPLLALGTICLAVLLVARWLKRIAGEASDRLLRRSEARFANLMELLRKEWEEDCRHEVARRLAGKEGEAPVLAGEIRRAAEAIRRGHDERDLPPAVNRIALLLVDMQDGAFLHRTDTKGVEQFLSHPDLWNLRHRHLGIDRKEEKRLDRLDLTGGRALSGPFFWFDMTTNALAVKLARLCGSYNLHLLPRDQVASASPEERERHRRLLAGQGGLAAEPGPGTPYRSSFFTFLHFLHPAPAWRDEVERVYGEAAGRRLLADRERVIREVFGTRALNLLPLEKRSFNPYLFYQARLSRGRFLLLPLFLLGAAARVAWLVGRVSFRAAREILDPKLKGADLVDRQAPFAVARRKLRLIKKPLLLEAIRLAARVDPTYLGLGSDGAPAAGPSPCERDLELAAPTTLEMQVFTEIRNKASRRLLYFKDFRREWEQAPAPGSPGERRLLAAFAMDEGGIAGLAAAPARARAWIEAAAAGEGPPSGGLPAPEGKMRQGTVRRGLRLLLERSDGPPAVRKVLREAVKMNLGDIRPVCHYLALGGAAPGDRARREAAVMAAGSSSFLAARETLQALLGLLVQDLRQHERLVHLLGGYPAEEEVEEERGAMLHE